MYATYVAGLTQAQQVLHALRGSDAAVETALAAAEAHAGSALDALLIAPARRLPEYGVAVEAMLSLTPLQAAERTAFCRTLGAVHELCDVVEHSLADHRSRARVAELAAAMAPALQRHVDESHPSPTDAAPLADGLAVPHRRYVSEGPLYELPLQGGEGEGTQHGARRRAILFNDILLLTASGEPGATSAPTAAEPTDERVHEVISLAKVQIRALSDGCAFELWSMARIWRYAAPDEATRAMWVQRLQGQVRHLLASFKHRGKSLAFLPQNVASLRAKLLDLHEQKLSTEQRVLDLTTQMTALDEAFENDQTRLAGLLRKARRSSVCAHAGSFSSASAPMPRGSVCYGAAAATAAAAAIPAVDVELPARPPPLSAAQLADIDSLRKALGSHGASKAQLQAVADGVIETLFQLSHALDAIDEQHNDDSLLQFMLYSSA